MKKNETKPHRFGTNSVASEGDKKTSSEAKHRVERPYVKLLGGFGLD